WGIGWYRKQLDIPASDRGRSIFLDIDGAMSYATVWLNGKLVGGWPYGYNSWRLDLTPYAMPGGTNQLAIRLDNPPDSARWYPGGGLYRNVWLTTTQPVHVAQWGTHVTTPQMSKQAAVIQLDVGVDNDGTVAAEVEIVTTLHQLDESAARIGPEVARMAPVSVLVEAHATARVSGSVAVRQPRLWGPPPTQKPNRYVAVTTLSQKGKLVDRYETPFGIRSLRFDPDTGLHV